jgi:hypothetical protein
MEGKGNFYVNSEDPIKLEDYAGNFGNVFETLPLRSQRAVG